MRCYFGQEVERKHFEGGQMELMFLLRSKHN